MWSMLETDGSWIMTVGYYKLNQEVNPIAHAMPDVASLSEQINISLDAIPGKGIYSSSS